MEKTRATVSGGKSWGKRLGAALLFVMLLWSFANLYTVVGVGMREKLPVLMYHHVLPGAENTRYKDNRYTLDLEDFEAQMRYLYENGFQTMTSQELLGFLDGGPLPGKRVMITFDDGYLSNLEYAYPVMKAYGFTGAIFLVTGSIPAQSPALDPDALTMLGAAEIDGYRDVFEFFSHTDNMHRLEEGAPALTASDEAAVRADLEASFSKPYVSTDVFSYPYGSYNRDVVRMLVGYGVRCAFVTQPGYVSRLSPPYALHRFEVPRQITMEAFEIIVNGQAG
ncbi:polysaccharide deacetylase family protein [Oscillospiraceae bacterium OttesenSCG-928-F05]|nr:polysaccharide deacetylase family protein [Oscillospiraceae bacterium OttesenSCG-928-F05]